LGNRDWVTRRYQEGLKDIYECGTGYCGEEKDGGVGMRGSSWALLYRCERSEALRKRDVRAENGGMDEMEVYTTGTVEGC
jgi:hypothetical protein